MMLNFLIKSRSRNLFSFCRFFFFSQRRSVGSFNQPVINGGQLSVRYIVWISTWGCILLGKQEAVITIDFCGVRTSLKDCTVAPLN